MLNFFSKISLKISSSKDLRNFVCDRRVPWPDGERLYY